MEENKTLEQVNENKVQVDAPAAEQPSSNPSSSEQPSADVATLEEHPIMTLEEPVVSDEAAGESAGESSTENVQQNSSSGSSNPNAGIMTLEERLAEAVAAAGADINILDLPTLEAADKVMVVSGNSIGYMTMEKLAAVAGGKLGIPAKDYGIDLDNETDLNNIVDIGVYYGTNGNTIKNAPLSFPYYVIKVETYTGQWKQLIQTYTNSSGDTFKRFQWNKQSWSEWK